MILEGYKTYLAALLAFGAAGYETFVVGNLEGGFNYFLAGLSLVGIRGAIATK